MLLSTLQGGRRSGWQVARQRADKVMLRASHEAGSVVIAVAEDQTISRFPRELRSHHGLCSIPLVSERYDPATGRKDNRSPRNSERG
jgi:hypothetical protein